MGALLLMDKQSSSAEYTRGTDFMNEDYPREGFSCPHCGEHVHIDKCVECGEVVEI